MADVTLHLMANALDSLDKLFDRELDIKDVEDLLFATEIALSNTEHHAHFSTAVGRLREIVRPHKTDDEINEAGLEATADLRVYLANLVELL